MDGAAPQSPQAATLGSLLKRYRLAAGMTQEELADRAQVGVRSIGDLERGAPRRPRSDTLRLLADALALAPEERAALVAAARSLRARTTPLATPAPSAPLTTVLRPVNPPHNLEMPLTGLIGRTAEVAHVRGMLARADVKLLTLCGVGGVGKTRLALQVAAELLDDFADGVYVVSLAPVHDPGLVAATITQALGLREAGAQGPVAMLRAYLRERRVLLLLDNFEHLFAAAPMVAELLAGSPGLKALITSRAALRLRGERQVPVAPLAVPNLAGLPPVADLAQVASVALLIERAQSVSPDFRLVPENALAVAAICHRLDGLPLAIELAAAWARLFSPHALLERLEPRLALLTGGQRDLPERQQTLRATFDWSYHLLDASQQAVFRRLAVFVGGCSLAALEAVCLPAKAPAAAPADVSGLDYVAALIDQSLALRDERASRDTSWDTSRDMRVAMLETVQEYARDQLKACGEVEATRRAHATYYLAVAEAAEPHLRGPEQDAWMARLDCDHGNLRAALAWALDQGEATLAMRLAAALWRFWLLRGHLREGQQWLERALALAAGAPPENPEQDQQDQQDTEASALRARALHGAGLLAYYRGDLVTARRRSEDSLALRRALGDTLGVAQTTNNLGMTLAQLGEMAEARERFGESLRLKRELNDTQGIASTLNNLGWLCSSQAEFAQAIPYFAESLELWRQTGNTAETGRTLANLGQALLRVGEDERAQEALEESLAVREALGDRSGAAHSLALLGDVASAQGDDDRAWTCFHDALALYRDAGSQLDCIYCLERLAGACYMREQLERAAQLFGASSALRTAFGAPLHEADQSDVERTVTALQQRLDGDAFQIAWAHGARMSFDEAVACAQGDGQPVQATSRGPSG